MLHLQSHQASMLATASPLFVATGNSVRTSPKCLCEGLNKTLTVGKQAENDSETV